MECENNNIAHNILSTMKASSVAVPISTRINKNEILQTLISQFEPLDFAKMLHPHSSDEDLKAKKVKQNEMRVLILDEILKQAKANNWNLCKQAGFCYLYNGAFWETLSEDSLKHFLSDCAKAMGVKPTIANDYKFVKELYEQFLFSANIQPPQFDRNTVLINLQSNNIHRGKSQQRKSHQKKLKLKLMTVLKTFLEKMFTVILVKNYF